MRDIGRLILLWLLLMAAACGPMAPVSPTPDATVISSTETAAALPTLQPTATASGTATVQFVHAAASITAITVYQGNTAVAGNLGYRQFTEPTAIPAGSFTLRALPAGARPDDTPLLEQAIDLQPGDSLLLVLDDSVTFLSFLNPYPALSTGESAVTLVNLLSGVPDAALFQDGAALTEPVPTNQISQPAILSGTTAALDIQSGTTVMQAVTPAVREGFASTLVLVGAAENPAVIEVTTKAPTRTALRVVNASTAADSVDVYLGDQLLAANVEYTHPTARQDVIAGSYFVQVYPAGADATTQPPIISQSVRLDSSPAATLYILGAANNPVIGVYADDPSAPPQGDVRITFVNTLDQYPTVRLETASRTLVTARFGEVPSSIFLDAGRYSFTWIGQKSDGSEETVEIANNVELLTGMSYWYLITGRTGSTPVIFSEPVKAEAGDAASTTVDAAQVRLINALEDQTPVEFLADDTPLATVEYAQSTALLTLAETVSTLDVQMNGSVLASTIPDLENGKRYTIVAYGAQAKQVKILVISDADLILSGDAPHLRLINASLDAGVRLGLAYSAAAPAIENEPEGTEEPIISEFRRSIPMGVTVLADDIPGNTTSGNILMSPGTVNLDILDSSLSQMATTLANMDLQAGSHYDVVAYQETAVPRVRAFLLVYPAD